jgi:signal transduction histidine kinase
MSLNLKSKIWLTVAAIVVMFSFFTLYYFPYEQAKLLLKNYNNEVQNLANTVSLGVKIAMTEQNFEGVQTAMEFVKDDARLEFISMLQIDTAWNTEHTTFKLNEKVINSYPANNKLSTATVNDEALIVKRSPFQTAAINGAIVIGFSTEAINASKQRIKTTSLLVSAVVFIIGILIGFWLSKTISRPVLALRDAAIRVQQGDLTQHVNIESNDEIGELGKSFNEMVDYLFTTTNKLKEANSSLATTNQALNNTVIELKATQDQLIQAEKMASLGELTAGIAHEIQNPLNFVNNFAEVSADLVQEMEHAIQENDTEEVGALSNDLKQNLNKIAFHGKRADAIVKGMLQHSRVTTGKKELVDFNSLADEYLRLSYHGLRAKDKTFNATLKTDYDANIGKVEVIPQDIGRVLLNLYSNSFYSITEKKKTSGGNDNYEPTIWVTTKSSTWPDGSRAFEISVKDNGRGIPTKIIDKIYQPFYTTKPTGQGTGLGLSLSYDIVTKGHNGEIKVQTKEGEFAEFIITIPI